MQDKQLFTTKEAAAYLSVSVSFLERDRWAGATIPYVRVGKRAVRYELETLKAYLRSRIRKPYVPAIKGKAK